MKGHLSEEVRRRKQWGMVFVWHSSARLKDSRNLLEQSKLHLVNNILVNRGRLGGGVVGGSEGCGW